MNKLKKPLKPLNNNGGIKIEFTLNKQRYWGCFKGFKWENNIDRAKAELTCKQIELDMVNQLFDVSDTKLAKYVFTELVNRKANYNLLTLWLEFGDYQSKRIEQTTLNNSYQTTLNIIQYVAESNPDALNINKKQAINFVRIALTKYAIATIERTIVNIKACINWAIQTDKLNVDNPYNNIKLPKAPTSTRSKQAFTREEVEEIINAFKDNTYKSPNSKFKDSYYANFVRFLFITGCRPEDAIALTWNDIDDNNITFSKAYSKGILKGTKTGITRLFPINKQLQQLLSNCLLNSNLLINNANNLVFPSQDYTYINLHNFTIRYWGRIVKGLVSDKKVSNYLPTYNLRNTAASLYMRNGVDMTTLGALLGTSEQMLQQHYLAPNKEIKLPNI